MRATPAAEPITVRPAAPFRGVPIPPPPPGVVRLSVTGKTRQRTSATPAPRTLPLTENDFSYAAEVEREVLGRRSVHPVDCDFCVSGAPHPKGML